MAGFVRVSGYSQKDIDDAYDAGYADGQVHPALTSQSRSYSCTNDHQAHETSVTFSFPHGVVGVVNGSGTPWVVAGPTSISGNTVTIRYYAQSNTTATVTAVGY